PPLRAVPPLDPLAGRDPGQPAQPPAVHADAGRGRGRLGRGRQRRGPAAGGLPAHPVPRGRGARRRPRPAGRPPAPRRRPGDPALRPPGAGPRGGAQLPRPAGRGRQPPPPGPPAHAPTLATLEGARQLRDHVLGRLEQADHEPDPAARRRWLTFVVAGGGFAGTEPVASLFDLVPRVLPYFPNARA